ncbi:hypothetical protein AAON49_11515 [Pseudotenacibaculum sp. MALMAid0570]|uniref:hypothetical protein n=1 Tax=Pseudotenacibaculum sp. MALMAid0570 TaxID=3143938 RepID=UPI0032DF83B1
MKKGVLFLLAMFMMVSYVEANNGQKSTKIFGVENRYDDAVSFVEKGIRFHVFLNGDFDFDSRYLRTRRNRRIPIQRDYQGRVKRIGNVYIRYDFRGNVRRIGSVYMRYNRGRLTNVGDLRIRYNRWGTPRFYGQVRYNDYYYNGYDSFSVGFNLNLGTICLFDDPYFYRSEFRNNYVQIREDDNFYYYRANKNAKVSRDRILKRRKPAKRTTQKRRGTQVDSKKRAQSKRSSENKKRIYTKKKKVDQKKKELKKRRRS